MPLVVGHRGAAGHAPENTLLSFQKGIDLGCHVVECDVHLSKEGEIIVIHDETVDRTTDGSGAVSDKTLEEIRKLSTEKGGRVPTLREVINLVRDTVGLQIELKGVGTPHAVIQLLQEESFSPHSIMSFKRELLTEARSIDKHVKLGLLFADTPPGDLWDFANKIGLTSICPHHSLVTPDMVTVAHSQGITVYAFHVNTQADGVRLLATSVDEIGTDYPELFLS